MNNTLNAKIIIYIILFIFISYIAKANVLVNSGYTKGDNLNKIYLTIDMCPSINKGYDKDLFDAIVVLSKRFQKAIPIAIAVSGYWILEHKDALEEIKALETQGYVVITWVNHGFQHHYDPNAPLEDNFMLHNNQYAVFDILNNHNLMIQQGLKPSNFFRFPGLISDDFLNNLLKEMDLITLGASAWLAKTRGKFSGGDIILLHGNTNDRLGVNLFIRNVKKNAFDNFEFASILDLESLSHLHKEDEIGNSIGRK